MPKPSDVVDEGLREQVQGAFDQMRAGDGTSAVKALAAAYLAFLDLKPELKTATMALPARTIPCVMRWPALGANMNLESAKAGAPEIEFVRDRFSVSEAMTYYQYLLDEIIEWQGD